MAVGSVTSDGVCASGNVTDRSPEMLHVWIYNPLGRFDADVYAPSEKELAEHFPSP